MRDVLTGLTFPAAPLCSALLSAVWRLGSCSKATVTSKPRSTSRRQRHTAKPCHLGWTTPPWLPCCCATERHRSMQQGSTWMPLLTAVWHISWIPSILGPCRCVVFLGVACCVGWLAAACRKRGWGWHQRTVSFVLLGVRTCCVLDRSPAVSSHTFSAWSAPRQHTTCAVQQHCLFVFMQTKLWLAGCCAFVDVPAFAVLLCAAAC